MGACCPRRCVGCQRGWPYDADSRHIAPGKFPQVAERWECNRVKWLGLRGRNPCTQRTGEVLWINSSGIGQQWIDVMATVVAWVLRDGSVKGGLSLAGVTPLGGIASSSLVSEGRPLAGRPGTPQPAQAHGQREPQPVRSAYLQLRYG
jgi:hypothetical protein